MFADIKTDDNNGIPIYKQISQCIQKAIASGALEAGVKLPTVRELAEETGVSRGTVKHAYEYLEQLGAIEMIQGRGSFVMSAEEDNTSRKERAMKAIDQLFKDLEKLGFTPREMEIYLDLKLRGLEEKFDVVRVAALDCNPEALHVIQRQLSQIGFVETATFAVDRVVELAERLNSDYDLIFTTSTHYGQVEPYIKDQQMLGMMSMTPSARTVINLAKIPDSHRVGVVCASDTFAKVVRDNSQVIGAWAESMAVQLFGDAKRLRAFAKDKDALIVPDGYEDFAAREEKEIIRNFEAKGKPVIVYDYKVDRGSFLYVEDRIRKCVSRKRGL